MPQGLVPVAKGIFKSTFVKITIKNLVYLSTITPYEPSHFLYWGVSVRVFAFACAQMCVCNINENGLSMCVPPIFAVD